MGKVTHEDAANMSVANKVSKAEWKADTTHLDSQGNTLEIARSATLIVAANDSSAKSKAGADYVCNGVADDVEIQAAIDALTGGGTVELSEGTFVLAANTKNSTNVCIYVTNDITLRGQGEATVLKLGNSSDWDVTASGGVITNEFNNVGDNTFNSHIIIRDLKIDVNESNQTSGGRITGTLSAISFHKTQDCMVENVHIVDGHGYGIIAVDSDPAGATQDIGRFTARGCFISGFTPAIPSPEDWSGTGIFVTHYMKGSVIDDCTIDDCNYGIILEDYPTDIRVINCHTRSMIHDGFILIGNYPENISYIGCHAVSSEVYGFRFSATNQVASSVTRVIGCSGVDCSGDGLVNSGFHRVTVVGGAFNRNVGHGIQSSGDYCIIINNECLGNGTSIAASGTGTLVHSNIGYVTENSDASVVASGDTTKVVTHGLATTPTVINIAFREQGSNDYGRWWLSAIGTTTFTLNVSADPGASNLDFGWEAKIR